MSSTHTLLISAVAEDAPIAANLEQRLRARGFIIHRAPDIPDIPDTPTSVAASSPPDAYDALLLILSPQAAAAPATLRAYRDALHQRKPILPLLARPAFHLPDELRGLHWIDMAADVELGWAGLLVALNTLGLLSLTTGDPPRFDAELALARAQQGLTPPTWRVYRPFPPYYIRASGKWLALLILLLSLGGPLLFAVSELLAGAIAPALAPLVGVLAWVVTGVVGALFVWRCARLIAQQRRSWLHPELLIVAPEGFVLRRFSGTTVCQFAGTATLSLRATPRNPAVTLLATPRANHPTTNASTAAVLDLRFGVLPSVLAGQIIAALAAYQHHYAGDGHQPSPTPATPALFISYARTNSRFADSLQFNLNVSGLNAWVDRSRLVGGQQWSSELRHAIETCAALLVVVTPDALASPVVRQEYEYALSLGKPVLPLLARPTQALPEALRATSLIDFTRPDGTLPGDRQLTLALDHMGIRPPTPPGPPRVDALLATARGEAGQTPPDWHVYHSTASRRARWVMLPLLTLITLFVLFNAVLIANHLIVYVGLSNAGVEGIGILVALGGVLALLGLCLFVAVRIARRPPSSLIVLTPSGIAMRAYGVLYAFQYSEITHITTKRSGGALRVDFTPRSGQHPMRLPLFRTDAPPAIIAQQIQADYARYPQTQPVPAPATQQP